MKKILFDYNNSDIIDVEEIDKLLSTDPIVSKYRQELDLLYQQFYASNTIDTRTEIWHMITIRLERLNNYVKNKFKITLVIDTDK